MVNMVRIIIIEEGLPARSMAWVCSRSLAGIAGSDSAGTMDVISCQCCVLSGRDLCFGQITRPEESCRV
jgi:hypothetical protein